MAEEELRGDIINHTDESRYVKPTDPEVLKKLEWFQDQKLAFMVHWGLYSQLGMCESWPLSDGDSDWSRTEYTWENDANEFRRIYFDMNKTFNPIRFDPDEWADFASKAGFRYFIYTTKHHDGFCMYDTAYSEYRITAEDCPYHANRNANTAKLLFDAFRKRGISIAPYFSKPDWHCPWYWAKDCERPIAYDRNPTYDPKQNPDLWEKYVQFTHNQLTELVEDLGPVEILWLDGGQVNPANGQDIRLRDLAPKLRSIKPGLLFADRTVGGDFENYITPEQQIPSGIMHCPWESCVSIGTTFAFTYDDVYKSPRQLVETLIKVTTRGGNLALNLGAQPDGRLPRRGMQAALGLGNWLNTYGEAIYNTRAAESSLPHGQFGFNRKPGTIYALKPKMQGEVLPNRLVVPWSGAVKSATVVGTEDKLSFSTNDEGVVLTIPENMRIRDDYAVVIRFEEA